MYKEISFTNGKYSIDEYGNVKRNKGVYENRRQPEKVLKSYLNNKGYFYIDLRINNQTKRFLIHRLVAMTFIENPKNYPIVNHIDAIPTNNYVGNLEWCTHSYNNKYAYDIGNKVLTETQIKVRSMPKTTLYKKVGKFDKDDNLIQTFQSVTQVYKELGYSISAIANCCTNRSKSSYGYVWKYI